MATVSFRPFASGGSPNAPGRCKWCGRKLRKKFDYEHIEPTPTSSFRKLDTFKFGDYGDGHFCGLRCGYEFAVWYADRGNFIILKKKAVSA
jgi:hypothetical protein